MIFIRSRIEKSQIHILVQKPDDTGEARECACGISEINVFTEELGSPDKFTRDGDAIDQVLKNPYMCPTCKAIREQEIKKLRAWLGC